MKCSNCGSEEVVLEFCRENEQWSGQYGVLEERYYSPFNFFRCTVCNRFWYPYRGGLLCDKCDGDRRLYIRSLLPNHVVIFACIVHGIMPSSYNMKWRKPELQSKRQRQKLKPDFKRHQGLITAVMQSDMTREVLMVAHMSKEAWKRTVESGEVWLWSTSRNELWHKGAASGNAMAVKKMRLDCDRDCVLISVEVCGDGVACYTGSRTCFTNR